MTIAVIDDDEAVRELTRGLLRALGYQAVAYENAEAFLDSGQVDKTACVITDMRMPGMSGVELQAKLSAGGHRMPVIFITSYPNDGVRERVLAAGARGFLLKPYREESLISCVEAALHP